jgi:hypothetical protein
MRQKNNLHAKDTTLKTITDLVRIVTQGFLQERDLSFRRIRRTDPPTSYYNAAPERYDSESDHCGTDRDNANPALQLWRTAEHF